MFPMHNLGPHILSDIDDALDSLRGQTSMMAALTERNLRNVGDCLLQGDQKRGDIAITDGAQIDLLDNTILRDGTDLLLRFHPLASDLRQVIASIRFSAIVKRVADEAVGIARHARPLCGDFPLAEVEWLRRPWLEATALFSKNVHAYASSNVSPGHPSQDRQHRLNDMNQQLAIQLRAAMNDRPERFVEYVHLLFIRYHVERICDHAKRIPEEIAYLYRADDIRNANNPFTELDLE